MADIIHMMLDYQKENNITRQCAGNCGVFMYLMEKLPHDIKYTCLPVICVYYDKKRGGLVFNSHLVISPTNEPEAFYEVSYEVASASPMGNRTYYAEWNKFLSGCYNPIMEERKSKGETFEIEYDYNGKRDKQDDGLKRLLKEFLDMVECAKRINQNYFNATQICGEEYFYEQIATVIKMLQAFYEVSYEVASAEDYRVRRLTS